MTPQRPRTASSRHARGASRPLRKGTGLRIIAGTLKGRRLAVPDWTGLRPTSDRMRETLFNVLGPAVAGARVLDGFAGTGALGIEALSRGATHVTFAERDRRALDLVAENLTRSGLTGGYTIVRADLDGRGGQVFAPVFDIALLDPPYDMTPEPVIAALADAVVPGGLLAIEHARRTPTPERAATLRRTRRIEAGDSAWSFYRRDAAGDDGAGMDA